MVSERQLAADDTDLGLENAWRFHYVRFDDLVLGARGSWIWARLGEVNGIVRTTRMTPITPIMQSMYVVSNFYKKFGGLGCH